MNGYKVKVYVTNDPKDEASGKVFNLTIIPRVGDYIDVNVKPDPINHPLTSQSGVFKVKNVYIHEVGSTFDAELHIESDQETE